MKYPYFCARKAKKVFVLGRPGGLALITPNTLKNPFLTGKAIYLRGLEEEDINGNYFQWFNDQQVCQFNSHGLFPNNLKRMKSYLDHIQGSRDILVLGIFDMKNDTHIGNISLQNIDWVSRNAEYAIIIGEKSYWGKGVAKEASDLILTHGFVALNLERIYCGTAEDNIGMQKLARYMGMQEEGVRRKAFYKNGRFKNLIEYGLLREEYVKSITK